MRRRRRPADRAALLDKLSAFLPAGFYYKTFLWPRWEAYEGAIRAMAGLGRVDPNNRPPAANPRINARCDLLVVGAGPAGLAAANAAARAGGAVILVDDHAEIGGQLVHRGGSIEGGTGANGRASVAQRDRSRGRAGDDANHGLRRLRRQSRLSLGTAGAAPRRALAHPADADRGRGRRDRAAARRPRQRPARRHVRRRGARLSPPLCGPYRQAHCCRDQQRQRLCRGRGLGRSRRGGRDSRFARGRPFVQGESDARRCDRRRRRGSGRRSGPGGRADARLRRASALGRMDADRASLRPSARAAAL